MTKERKGVSFSAVILVGLFIFAAVIILTNLFPKDAVTDNGRDKDQVTIEEVVAEEAEPAYDFSDDSNWNLTVSAWERMAEGDYDGVFAYANRCLELYELEARDQAKGMQSFARVGHEDDYAVLNDVATCHYVMGETYMKMGENNKALREFRTVIEEYPYAQCWDPKGWFWKVAEVSYKNIEKIQSMDETQR